METAGEEYKGHRIELRAREGREVRADEAEREEDLELLIDDKPVRYGRLPDGQYALDEYTFAWSDNLMDLARRFIDYQDRPDAIRREALLQEIAKNATTVEKYGWRNYGGAWVVAIISVGASIASSIIAALGTVDKTFVAILAAIPAVLLTVTRTFNFEQRGVAHFDTKKQLDALTRKLKYEGASLEAISQQYSVIDLETFRGWTRFSTLTQPEPNGSGEPPAPGRNGSPT